MPDDGGITPKVCLEHSFGREREIIERCINDRVYFAEVVLGIELEQWQFDVLTALDSGETRVSIRSGNGAGKTCLVSIIALHYLLFRNDVKIPVTAPSSGQLRDGLIPECHKWIRRLPAFLSDLIDTTQDRVVRRDSPANNFISFRTARKETPEALQGIHATFVLCLVDEASGVHDTVYEAAQGTMSTPGSIFIMISNPTRLSGYFYNSHNRNKAQWRRFHVTSFDTSRVDQSFVDSIETTYGMDSDQYRVKVLGDFPTQEEETLMRRDLVLACYGRDIAQTGKQLYMGVDCGRGGDLSALCFRQGNHAWGFQTKNYADTMQTVGWVKDAFDQQMEKLDLRPEAIYVDSIGIGAGVADRLRELLYPCVDVNVAESPSLKHVYVRMRDELWWKAKEWIESGQTNLTFASQHYADLFESEICAPLGLFTSTGKNGVETKAQLKQRGYPSPNLADAFIHTFMFEHSIAAGAFNATNSTWNNDLEYNAPASVY